MNEEMKAAWLEISQMLGEPTREELDVFLRTWQRASQATREALAEQPARPYRLLQDNGSKYFGDSWDKAEQPAQQALDKMAENARELGIQMQPAQDDPCPGCRKGVVCRTPKCGRLKLPVDHPYRSEQPAQQEPAPVQGWRLVPVKPTDEMRDVGNVIIKDRGALFAAYRAMLNAAPQPAQQEPVACANGCRGFVKHSPPTQRTWVALTDEEIEKLITDAGFTRSDLLMMGACIDQIARLVEAKLRSKNEDRN